MTRPSQLSSALGDHVRDVGSVPEPAVAARLGGTFPTKVQELITAGNPTTTGIVASLSSTGVVSHHVRMENILSEAILNLATTVANLGSGMVFIMSVDPTASGNTASDNAMNLDAQGTLGPYTQGAVFISQSAGYVKRGSGGYPMEVQAMSQIIYNVGTGPFDSSSNPGISVLSPSAYSITSGTGIAVTSTGSGNYTVGLSDFTQNTLIGVGAVDGDGYLQPFVTTVYVAPSDTLRQAAISLDSAVYGVSTTVDTEVARATSAEISLGVRIDDSEARAISAEASLGGKVDDADARAVSAEVSLGAQLGAMEARAISAETSLGGKIDAADARASSAEVSLGAQLGAIEARAISAETSLGGKIDDADARASSAEISLGVKIDDADARAASAEVSLGVRIDDADARAVSAEVSLSGKIDDADARAVSAEVSLGVKIDGADARASSAEISLGAQAAGYDARAASAEVSLSGKIDDLSARTTSTELSLATCIYQMNDNTSSVLTTVLDRTHVMAEWIKYADANMFITLSTNDGDVTLDFGAVVSAEQWWGGLTQAGAPITTLLMPSADFLALELSAPYI